MRVEDRAGEGIGSAGAEVVEGVENGLVPSSGLPWRQLKDRAVEPASSLGDAINVAGGIEDDVAGRRVGIIAAVAVEEADQDGLVPASAGNGRELEYVSVAAPLIAVAP